MVMAKDTTSRARAGGPELVVAMVISGTIGVFVVESEQSAFNVVFFRCLFGAITLGAYCLARGYLRGTGLTPSRLALAAFGGVCIVANWVLLFSSYSLTSITLATVVYHTQPFVVLFLGALVFGDRITRNKVAWVVVAFLGVLLVTKLWTVTGGNDTGYWIGVGYALGAAVLYGVATIVAKRLKGIRPHVIALVQVTIGIPLLLPFATLSGLSGIGADWGWLIGLGVLHTCVMYVLMYSAFQKLPTATIAVLSFIYPAVAIVIDFVVYGTRISPLQLLGVALIVIASLGNSLNWRLGAKPSRALPAPAPVPTPATTSAKRNH